MLIKGGRKSIYLHQRSVQSPCREFDATAYFCLKNASKSWLCQDEIREPGAWREFGACYRTSISFRRLLQELHGSVHPPSPPEIWLLCLLQEEALGQGASSGGISGLKSQQGENLDGICCSKSASDRGNPALEEQAAAGDVDAVSNWEHLCTSVHTVLHFSGTARVQTFLISN